MSRRFEADQAARGGVGRRLPNNWLPNNPTIDHEVCFALGDVERAVKEALVRGATVEEIQNVIRIVSAR